MDVQLGHMVAELLNRGLFWDFDPKVKIRGVAGGSDHR